MSHSPGPWWWRPEPHSSNVLVAADGDTIALYDEAYLRPRGAVDVANRALIAAAPDMAAMLRELEYCDRWEGEEDDPRCRWCAFKRSDGRHGYESEPADRCRMGRLMEAIKR